MVSSHAANIFRKAPAKVPQTRASSGREAHATGERTTFPDPLHGRQTCAQLTPARWLREKIGSHFPRSTWGRGAVLYGTGGNRLGNVQAFVIADECVRFPRFPDFAGGYVCAGAGARTHVWGQSEIQGTREPVSITYRIQWVSGSLAGSLPVPLGTARPNLAGSARIDAEAGFLEGGYCAGPIVQQLTAVIWGQNDGRGAKSFRVSVACLVAAVAMEGVREIGGFLRFSTGRAGRVGSLALEGSAQRRGNAWFAGTQRQPSRLARRQGVGSIARAHRAPLCPHSPRALALAPWRTSVSGFGSRTGQQPDISVSASQSVAVRGCAEFRTGATGRGWGGGRSGAALTGRGGEKSPCAARRMSAQVCHARGGRAHVN